MRYLDDGLDEVMASPDPPYQDPDTEAFEQEQRNKRNPALRSQSRHHGSGNRSNRVGGGAVSTPAHRTCHPPG